jgi:signal transduction histidine kinase
MLIPASAPAIPAAILADSRRDLLRTSQLALAGELVRAIVHDLRQPVTSVTVNVELAIGRLQRRPSDVPGALAALADVMEGGRQMGSSLRVLHDLLAHRSPDRAPVAMQHLLAETVRLVQTEANARHVAIGVLVAPDLPLSSVDVPMIRQAMLSMLLDAVENARPADGVRITLTLANQVAVALSIRHVRREDSPLEDAWALAVARWVSEAHGVALHIDSGPEGQVTVQSQWPVDTDVSRARRLA